MDSYLDKQTIEKARTINRKTNAYGTFAEIGAGQEVARTFFLAGASSHTIAKTMSAYDMTFSDAIYGKDPAGRYVSEARLKKMLEHEYGLIQDRLSKEKGPDKRFFAFADTVTTQKKDSGRIAHGWLGVRFQLTPMSEPNTVFIHIRLRDEDILSQQAAIGSVGTNLLYSALHYTDDLEKFVATLIENVGNQRVDVDMIHIEGPNFTSCDNRLLSLYLVKNHLTDAVIFNPEGQMIQPSDLFWKKNILALRGSFRPPTLVNMDMLEEGAKQFYKSKDVKPDNTVILSEITLNNLSSDGEIEIEDFLSRAELLCDLGQYVLISNYSEYYRLASYFSRYSQGTIGLILGVSALREIFDEKYYQDLRGGVLESMGILFSKNLKLFAYPSKDKNGDLEFAKNLKISKEHQHLYQHIYESGFIEDIEGFHPEFLDIFSRDVLKLIKNKDSGWEDKVPKLVAEDIKKKHLFGF